MINALILAVPARVWRQSLNGSLIGKQNLPRAAGRSEMSGYVSDGRIASLAFLRKLQG